jgi:two-component system NtrC family response regulator
MTQQKPKLLIIEDDPGLQKQLRWSLDAYDVVVAGDREAALAQIRRHEPAVCTMDLGLPPDPDGSTEGLATLQQILALAPDTRVIVLTGNQDHANAVKAIGMGAYDFHQKPVDPEVLNLVIQRAFFLHNLQQENRRMQQSQADSPLAGVISRDPGMSKVCRTIEKVAPTSASVMLLGESGTGKEVLARAIHALSPRAKERFMAINCAAIPENLLESELFGYEKGAFTGAAKQTKGKVELAHGGTFFLDEVGDLPMALQAKLLRFLQERVIERIGGHDEIPVDVRIVCATHQKLKDLCAQGRFREDLYYRLSEIVVTIPPLRQREGDAALLAHHFKNKFCAQESRSSLHFAPDALAAIEAYQWPGKGVEEEPLNLRQVRDEAEYKAIARALARTDGNIVKASEMLGVSRPTLYDLMGRHGIKASA